ncbi:MAG: hypothetical protein LBP89_03550 [Helicobacteraceae bacterium]|jgi:hypothetical protein|nr:hypothetical protein [Helicobacteraceae bacterium]
MKVVFAAIFALLLVSCADKAANPNDLSSIPVKAPQWTKQPDINGRFSAAGGAAQSIGGARFQQIEASAKASDSLRVRIEKIAINAAKECLSAFRSKRANDAAIESDARLLSFMIGARSAVQFERVDNWWSPTGDYYALFRLSETALKATIVDMIAQFVAFNESYSANFDMLRGLELIENAAIKAIEAAKQED